MKNLKVYHLLLLILVVFIFYYDYQWYQSIDFSTNNDQSGTFVGVHFTIGLPLLIFVIIFTGFLEMIIKILNTPLKIKR